MRLIPSRTIAVLVVVSLWVAGCSRGGDPGAPGGDSALRVPGGTPVVLISADTLRSDRLPAYGYDAVETPAIDSLRRDGILYERAYCNVPLTLPSHTSLLTGLLPPDHGVRDNLGYTVDPSKDPLLQQTLKEAGYATGAGVSAFVLRRATGIGAGFDLYEDKIEIRTAAGDEGVQTIQRQGRETVDAIAPWLRTLADQAFFLFVHIFEPHTPYEPLPEFAARFSSPYDGEVAAADDAVGALLDELRSLDAYERALIVFLSDLVEDPDELHNLVDSEPALRSELRATLNAFVSELAAPAETDEETRSRLAALGYVGSAVTPDDEVLPDPKTQVGTLAEIKDAYRLYANGDLEAAVQAYQRIVAQNPKIEDAWEYLALAQLGMDRPRDAAATYEAALEQIPESQSLSLRAAQLFELLGRSDDALVYANIAIPHNPPAAHLLLAQIAFKKGDLESAEMEAREAMSSGRRQAGPWLVLADISIARGEPYEAIDLLIQALDEGVTEHSIHAKLAITDIWVGQFDLAWKVLEGFEGTNDLGLLLAYGRLALSREQWIEARGWFERALGGDPDNPMIKLNLGFVAVADGGLDDAQELLEDGLSGNPRSFEGWDTLGMVFARQGVAYSAIAAWERAHEINPAIIGVVCNLGLGYAQVGQLEKTIAHFEEFAARAEPGRPQRDQAQALIERLKLRVS